jgi:PX domain
VIKKKSYSYHIQKRFSDFVDLHKQFNINYDVSFENFPSKVTFHRSKETVRKERKASLEKFLNYLRLVAIQNLDYVKFPELYCFLEMGTCRK